MGSNVFEGESDQWNGDVEWWAASNMTPPIDRKVVIINSGASSGGRNLCGIGCVYGSSSSSKNPPRDKRNSGDGASGTGRAVYASRGSDKKYDIARTSPENPSGGGKREIVSFRKCFEHGNLRSLNFQCCCVSEGRIKRFNSPVDHFFKIVRFFGEGKPL